MGSTLRNNEAVCADDSQCSFEPNPGSGPGVLGDLVGNDAEGTWQLCLGDGARGDSTSLDSFGLDLVLEPPS